MPCHALQYFNISIVCPRGLHFSCTNYNAKIFSLVKRLRESFIFPDDKCQINAEKIYNLKNRAKGKFLMTKQTAK